LSPVKSGGDAVSPLAAAGLIACKDASLFDAFSCPWPPSSIFYKLLEIERPDESSSITWIALPSAQCRDTTITCTDA
jgi:hypothetical protein